MQNESAKTKQLIKKSNAQFPVYKFLNLSAAKCGRGIPHVVLFDHNGKVLANGRVSDDQIAKAVEAAPSGMLMEADVNLHKKLAKKLIIGKPVKSTLNSLMNFVKKDANSPAGKEAQDIYDSVVNCGIKTIII